MLAIVYKIEEAKPKKTSLLEKVDGVSNFHKLSIALHHFYHYCIDDTKPRPYSWNPVFVHYPARVTDPHLYDFRDQIPEKLWEPVEEDQVMPKLRSYLESVYTKTLNKKYLEKIQPKLGPIGVNTPIAKQYIFTREQITKKVIIIGFFNVVTHRYDRFLIKDVKKVCRHLRLIEGEYATLLGRLPQDRASRLIKRYTKHKAKTELVELLSNLVVSIKRPTTNRYILEMLRIFNKDKKVLPFSK